MDVDAQLAAVDRATLTPLVRQALHSDAIEVLDWHYAVLGAGVGNPVSLGIYRFSGRGRQGAETLPWSLVLKIAQSPANVGETNMGEGDDAAHWNYWKREMLLYRSGFLGHLPAGLAAPRFFHAVEQPGEVVWMWMEEIQPQATDGDPLASLCLAARHFGRFNGRYALPQAQPSLPFLSRQLARQWAEDLSEMVAQLVERLEQPAPDAHPRLRDFLPGLRSNALVRAWLFPAPILAALERLPQTICHHDACSPNFMVDTATSSPRTIAIDWALTGFGPVGAELAMLVQHLRKAQGGANAAQMERAMYQAYLDGLHDEGWRGDVDSVRFAFAAWSLYRIGLYFAYVLNSTLDEFAENPVAGAGPLEDLYTKWSLTIAWLTDLAEEVWRHPLVTTA